MYIKQFRYGVDNLAYLICGKKTAIAVDPGAVTEIIAFLEQTNLRLQTVVNTHTHPDHMTGNTAILRQFDADYITMQQLLEKGFLELEKDKIKVYHTPGHSADSVIFSVGNGLITGDTLLTGKVGRCFTGDLKSFLESIKLITSFPDETIIYGGHDYVHEYLDTARSIEPENTAIDEFEKIYNVTPKLVCSTLSDEYRINPTLRFNHKNIIAVLKKNDMETDSEYKRWQAILSLV